MCFGIPRGGFLKTSSASASQAQAGPGRRSFKNALSELPCHSCELHGYLCVLIYICVLGITRGWKELTMKTSFASQVQAGTDGLGSFKFVQSQLSSHSC